MNRKIMLVSLIALVAIMAGSCGTSDTSTGSTNFPPGVPQNNTTDGSPANDALGVSLEPTLKWICIDPDGDNLVFRVSFSENSALPDEETGQSAFSWSPSTILEFGTTYFWKVRATDPDGASSSSTVMHFTTEAAPSETITAPVEPDGPSVGPTGELLTFTPSGAVSSEGHALEYRFAWGDGFLSAFSASGTASHSWSSGGDFLVITQARCIEHNTIQTSWSPAHLVEISEDEAVSPPSISGGPLAGETDQSLSYVVGGSISNIGHEVEYRFDWGDGSISTWATTTDVAHAWSAADTYLIKAQARCIADPSVESTWSADWTVVISVP